MRSEVNQPPTPVWSERCVCNALIELGPGVDVHHAENIVQRWRTEHACPRVPAGGDGTAVCADMTLANDLGLPVLGFRGAT